MLAFSDRVIRYTKNKACWYEYCPSEEKEFKDMVRPLLHQRCLQSDAMIRQGVNSYLDCGGMETVRLHKHSSLNQWEDAYWALYLQGDIVVGYMKSGRVGLRIFAATKPEQRYLI